MEPHPDLDRLAQGHPSRLADAISAITHPGWVVTALTIYVALRAPGMAAWSPALAMGWAAVVVVFCAGLPFAVLLVLVWRGIVSDRHLLQREQRTLPSAIALGSVLFAVALLATLGAPRPLLALVAAMLAGLLSITVATSFTKASVHLGVVCGAAAIVAHVESERSGTPISWLPAVAAVVVVLVVGWARVSTGRHSLLQVVVGGTLGALSAGAAYWFLT